MPDSHLRQLQRDAAQGDLEAEARLMRARVRAGELTQDRLRLAAFLGDPAALEAVGERLAPAFAELWADALSELDEESDPRVWSLRVSRRYAVQWCRGLGAWGQEAAVRVALAAARSALPALDPRRPADDATHRALAAAETWLLQGQPAGDEQAHVTRSVQTCVVAGDEAAMTVRGEFHIADPDASQADHAAATATSLVAYAAGSLVLDSALDSTVHVLRNASRAWFMTHPTDPTPDTDEWACPADPPAFRIAVHQAIRAEVVPWALTAGGDRSRPR